MRDFDDALEICPYCGYAVGTKPSSKTSPEAGMPQQGYGSEQTEVQQPFSRQPVDLQQPMNSQQPSQPEKKRSVRKLLAACVALVLIAAIVIGVIVLRDKPPVETTVTESSVSVVEPTETATEASTTSALSASLNLTSAKPFNEADRLEPMQSDLDRLADLLDWSCCWGMDYDSGSTRVLDFIASDGSVLHMGMEKYDLLVEGKNYFYDYEFEDDDPRGWYGKSYVKMQADVLEYYMENVFHNFSYKSAREKPLTEYDDISYYYDDGWYYFPYRPGGRETYPEVREHKLQSNGHERVTIDLIDAFDEGYPHEPLTTIEVDATLTLKDGRRLWTIYSSKVTYTQTWD